MKNGMVAGVRVAALTLVIAGLAACGGSGSSSSASGAGSSTSITVVPSLGKVLHTDFQARCLATNLILGSGNTGTSGSVSLAPTGSCAGPVMVELLPGTASTYFDEATGNNASIPSGTKLRALIPAWSGAALAVAVTPLTEIATRQALHSAGDVETAVTAAQASAANSTVVTQVLGASTASFDILKPPSPWDGSTAAGSLGSTDADRYAFYLAALARLGGTSGSPALNVADALATDLADGTLDGTGTGSFTYTSGGLSGQLHNAETSMAGFASSGLLGSLGLGGSGGAAISTASGDLAAGLAVRTYPAGLVDAAYPETSIERLVTDGNKMFAYSLHVTGSGPVENIFYMMSSTTDGLNWSTPQQVNGVGGYQIAMNGNGIMAAVSCSAGSGTSLVPVIKTSTDGINWTSRTAPALADGVPTCINGGPALFTVGNTFVAIGQKCGTMSSTDGTTWTAGTIATSGFGVNGQYACGVVYPSNGKLIVEHGITHSTNSASVGYSVTTDGSTWTPHSFTVDTNSGSVSAMAFLPSGETRLYTMPSYTGVTTPATVWSSTDLASWTAATPITYADLPKYFQYYGTSALSQPLLTTSPGGVEYICDRSQNSGAPNYFQQQYVFSTTDGINFTKASIFDGSGALASGSFTCDHIAYLSHANRLVVFGTRSTSTAQPLTWTDLVLSSD